jgi:hypothetical protein
MRNTFVVSSAVLLSLSAVACNEQTPSGPETFVIPVYARTEAQSSNFGTPMYGAEEVPPVANDFDGQAIFKVSADGTTMSYKVITSEMHGVTQSHIHIGNFGTNGPIVVFLFGFISGGVDTDGILAQGSFTAANLIARPGIGFGATMPELVAKLRSGGAYVNVHTVAHPGGEIRGQIEEHGPTK